MQNNEAKVAAAKKSADGQIEALKAEITAANGKIVCKCGKEIEDDATFCKYCGAKVEKPAPKAEPVAESVVEAESEESVEA